ncbi:hypothetical protein EV196_1111 [Mariniflexile fucanivorans]|uniref:Uncharacterized protein n=1 Tax=Mariniflexile fucanivorans TaxID=264023 RepID=A0A4R1RAR3_9FLAO|nr:hypothetical protein EV196_1111 [Mariniflexile fucanivorans]
MSFFSNINLFCFYMWKDGFIATFFVYILFYLIVSKDLLKEVFLWVLVVGLIGWYILS